METVVENRKNYSSYNRDLYFERSKVKMGISIYLEELCMVCEEIEELRKFDKNLHAQEEEKRKIEYAKQMLAEVKEWLKV